MATTEIQQAAIYRCTDKATREVFYVVKSDSQNAWYTLRFDAIAAEWTCDCPATKPCKHIRAVNDVLKIRRARLAEQIGGDMPAIVAQIQAKEERRVPARQCETWGGDDDTPEHPAPLYGPPPAVIFGCARATSSKRARQFVDAPLNGNAGFSLLKPAH